VDEYEELVSEFLTNAEDLEIRNIHKLFQKRTYWRPNDQAQRTRTAEKPVLAHPAFGSRRCVKPSILEDDFIVSASSPFTISYAEHTHLEMAMVPGNITSDAA
jgi:hypothetical protein